MWFGTYAPHDLSIIMYIMGEIPMSVNCQGKAHFKSGIEDVATTTLNFKNGLIAFIHSSWLDPNKIRKTTIVGSRKMLVYDDIEPQEKIKIYDKGVEVPPYYDTFAEFQLSYRYGDIYSPRIEDYEPLKKLSEHFIDCVKDGRHPHTDGYNGLKVVSILEAASTSLKQSGKAIAVKTAKGVLCLGKRPENGNCNRRWAEVENGATIYCPGCQAWEGCKNLQICKSLWLRDRRQQPGRLFCGNSEKCQNRKKLQNLQPYLHLRRSDHRRRRLHRPQCDFHQ